MKPIYISLIAAFALCVPFTSEAIQHNQTIENQPYLQLTVGDILDMNAREFKAYSGKKLSLKDRIVFGLVKNQLKRGLRAGTISHDSSAAETAARAEGSFNVGAFILGFLLGLIGFLIVILAFDDKQAWKWALLGMGLWLVIWVLLFL